MGLPFPLPFKNRIEWRFWYKAALAAFAFFLVTFFSFSGWSVVMAFIVLLIAFFSRRGPQEEPLAASFWVFSAALFTGLALIAAKTSFFRFWEFPQLLPGIPVFVVFLFLFSMTVSSAPYRGLFLSVWSACLMFAVSTLSMLLMARMGPFAYVLFFIAAFVLLKENISRMLRGYSLRVRAYALVGALILSEVVFMFTFLPLGPLFAGALTAAFFVFFLDLVDAHGKGTISAALIGQKAVIFGILFLSFALAVKWAL